MTLARPVVIAALLCAAIAGAWYGSLDASFQFDDWNVVVRDSRVDSVSAWWQALPGIRPILKLSYALNHEFASDPWGFRLFNIAVHAVNTLLVFSLIRRRTAAEESSPAAAALFTATFVAMVFALEPVQTEAVTYVSGRSSSLAALACLGALCCWEGALRGTRPGLLHIAGAACYAIGIAIKETAWILPLALVVWESTKIPGKSQQTPGSDACKRQRRVALYAYGSVALLAVIAAAASPTYRHLIDTSLDTRPIGGNLLVQGQAWAFLSAELVRLAAINADPPLAQIAAGQGVAPILWVVSWGVLLIVAWVTRGRTPRFSFGVLWFAVWLLPTNTLLPRLDAANDRQLYLALIGPAWLVALPLAKLAGQRSLAARNAAWGLLAVTALTLGAATIERNRIYRTEISFWQDALLRSPTNTRAANNLGYAYARACRPAEAAREFQRALALEPDNYRARINLEFLQEGGLPGVACSPPPRQPVAGSAR